MTDPTLASAMIQDDSMRAKPFKLIVRGGLHWIRGNKKPYFSLTCSYPDGGGATHDLILKHFPQFADLAALHLADIDGVPHHALANGFYLLAGAFPGPLGERYHAGNSYRNPTPDECLSSFAKLWRLSPFEAEVIRADIWAVAMKAEHSRNAIAKARLLAHIDHQMPRWKAEAEACIAKHGLLVFGDEWDSTINASIKGEL